MEQHDEKSASFFRFEDLRVYAKSTNYAQWVTSALAGNSLHTPLANSFCHSAYDIALNIAEGASRSKSQFEHYLKISKTAIRECVVYTEVAARAGIFNSEQELQSRESLKELTRMIGALIISLQRTLNHRASEAVAPEADEPLEDDSLSY